MQRKTVVDVENLFDYLQGVVSATRRGEDEIKIAYPYARTVLQSAKQSLSKLNLYEAAEHAINESERLILDGLFEEADKLLLDTVRDMMERSGTNARLRKLYAPRGPLTK
jgi:hypothetical protein